MSKKKTVQKIWICLESDVKGQDRALKMTVTANPQITDRTANAAVYFSNVAIMAINEVKRRCMEDAGKSVPVKPDMSEGVA